jgi:hypothetical protein
VLTVLSIALGVLVVITITVFTGYFGAQEATSAPSRATARWSG